MKYVVGCIVVVLPLALLIDVLGMFDWQHEGRGRAGDRPEVSPPASVKLDSEQRVFLLKEYDTVVKEIGLRTEHEHTMITLKFTLVGAILGVILYAHEMGHKPPEGPFRSTWMALCCWSALVVAAIVDLRRQTNVDVIVQLGNWVRSLESRLLPGPIGWEHFVYSSERSPPAPLNPFWHSRFYPLLRLERELLTWALYLLAVTRFVPSRDDTGKSEIEWIARLFGLVVFLLFGLYSLHFHYQEPPWGWIYPLILTVLGIILLQVWIGLRKGSPAPAVAGDGQASPHHLRPSGSDPGPA